MTKLASKHCNDNAAKLDPGTQRLLAAEVPSWSVKAEHLSREFTFPDFKSALAFVNKIGEVAEAENHHPDLELGWGKVGVKLTTHSASGLTENDFVIAARIDQIS